MAVVKVLLLLLVAMTTAAVMLLLLVLLPNGRWVAAIASLILYFHSLI